MTNVVDSATIVWNGVGTADHIEVPDGGITEPKLSIGNAPSAGQVISWDGSNMQWVTGGTGDITAVTTAAVGGLSGGVALGAANLTLNLAGVASYGTEHLASGDLLYAEDISATDRRKTITGSSLLRDLFRLNTTAHAGTLASSDRLMAYDTSATEPRYLTLARVREWVGYGSARYWKISPANVAVTASGSALTTGESITLALGDTFSFIAEANWTSASNYQISVDGTQEPLFRSDGVGGIVGVTTNTIYNGRLVQFIYDGSDFIYLGSSAGTAQAANVGIVANTIPVPTNAPVTGQVLGFDGTNVEWTLAGGSGSGNQRTFVIADSSVGGTVDAIELTTGLAISLNEGDEFRFTPSGVNTGAVTIAVDGSTARALYLYFNTALRLFGAGDLLDGPSIVTYDEGLTRFLWRPAAASTASYYEVGVGENDLAILVSGGVFDPNRLGTGAQANRVLTWASGGASWADLPAGGGVSTVSAGTGIDVAVSGSDFAVSLEAQYIGRSLGTTSPAFFTVGSNYRINLRIGVAPTDTALHLIGDTYTFTLPDPLTGTGTDSNEVQVIAGTTGTYVNLQYQNGSVVTQEDLAPGELHVMRWDGSSNFVLVSPNPIIVLTTATSGLTSAVGGGAVSIAINADLLTPFSDATVATDDELILYNDSALSTERVTVAQIAAAIGTSAGVSSVTSTDSNIAVSPTTGAVRLTLADQVNAWTWYTTGGLDVINNLITIDAPMSYNAEKAGDSYTFHLSVIGSTPGDVSIRIHSTGTTYPLRDGSARRVQADDLTRLISGHLQRR